MKDSFGASRILKSLYEKLQDVLYCRVLPNDHKRLDIILESKIMKIRGNRLGQISFKTIDSIIMKFPQFREGFKEVKDIFKQYDENSNGAIDVEELKKCLYGLDFGLGDDEIDDLFHYCDMDENKGIEFNEFIVLLCLAYLLADPSTSSRAMLNTNWPQIESTFNTIIEVFLFLDKRGDGKLKKKDVVRALNEASPKEKSPSHITRSRFKEMDWDGNGRVSFKEFVYSFISWVGIKSDEESPTQ